ncbi:uncharacterized protein LOC129734853 [Falco cherrug]|uniref:uncharacterized protein LOC129734853 n=1 Tax=Falco cherrug TaxID=345164 RepID=UPI00247929F8|nr:uncharacterized protein LOC129734853 [Falco cherrug]
MERQATYDSLICFLEKRSVRDIDCKKALPGLLAYGIASGSPAAAASGGAQPGRPLPGRGFSPRRHPPHTPPPPIGAMAMQAAKRADIWLPPEVNRILYIRNLPYKITAEEMYDIFGKYGPSRQLRVGDTPETRGTA